MSYLYHRVPSGLSGDTLFPLNSLQFVHPKVYAHHLKKYDDRPWLQPRRIPTLKNILWGAALQFSAIHPLAIKRAMLDAGGDFSGDFFLIDPESLDPAMTTVFLYSQDVDTQMPFLPSEFVPYVPGEIDKHRLVGQATRDHILEFLVEQKEPYPYCRTPHILFAGTIKFAGLERIKV